MKENIKETEQWLLTGDCSKCRRYRHCSKPCTKNKRRTDMELKSLATQAMDKVTGGAFSKTMKVLNDKYL